MAPWRMPRHRMKDEYIGEYLKHFDRSDPVGDYEDRAQLYGL